MSLLERLNAAEVASHRHAGLPWGQFGPFTVLGSGLNLPLDSAWHDGTGVPTAQELADLKAFCAGRGQAVTIHALSHAAPALLPALREAGYSVSYVLHLYAHDLAVLPPAPELAIRQEADPEVWASVSAQGFGAQALSTMRLVARHPQVQRFLAWVKSEVDAGEPAGSAALQLNSGVAALYGASTRPEFRGWGVQRSLLAYRLRAAQMQGATLASVFVTPGTPSERNIVRAGFRLAGMRLTFSAPS